MTGAGRTRRAAPRGRAGAGNRSQAQWRCPRCGHRFVTPNLPHSCGTHRLADHFAGRPRHLRPLFSRFVALARACGPVTVYAQKSRIVLQSRVRFASAIVHADWLEANIWLRRRTAHRALRRTESLGAAGWYLHFSLREPSDLDKALAALVREAYEASET